MRWVTAARSEVAGISRQYHVYLTSPPSPMATITIYGELTHLPMSANHLLHPLYSLRNPFQPAMPPNSTITACGSYYSLRSVVT